MFRNAGAAETHVVVAEVDEAREHWPLVPIGAAFKERPTNPRSVFRSCLLVIFFIFTERCDVFNAEFRCIVFRMSIKIH